MADAPRHLSPLSRQGRERFEAPGGAILLEDRSLSAKFLLRGRPEEPAFLAAAEGALGVAPPLEPNGTAAGDKATVFWTQPDEWLVVAAPAESAGLMAALGDAVDGSSLAMSAVVGAALLASGWWQFRRMDRHFADIV